MYEYKAQEIFHKCHHSVHSDHEFVQKNGCLNISFLLKNASQVTNTAEPLVSSPELKAQVSFSDHLSSVCPSVCPSVCKLFTFSSSSPEPLGQFQPNLAQSILGWRGFKFVQMKGPALFQGEIITQMGKIHSFSKISRARDFVAS